MSNKKPYFKDIEYVNYSSYMGSWPSDGVEALLITEDGNRVIVDLVYDGTLISKMNFKNGEKTSLKFDSKLFEREVHRYLKTHLRGSPWDARKIVLNLCNRIIRDNHL